MKGRFPVLAVSACLGLCVLGSSASNGAVVMPSATGFDVIVTAADLGVPISVPDPGDPGVPLTVSAPGLEIAIFNDSGVTLDFAALTFTVPAIGPPPIALSISSPDLDLDPPEGPGFFDLTLVGPGTYTASIGMGTGIPDDADAIPDGTFLILYAPDGGPASVDFTGVTLLVVPEPSSALLLGLAGLLAFRRRRG